MDKIWKDIPIIDGYEASTIGEIRNKKTGKVLCGGIKTNNEYGRIILNGKSYLRHRLVALTFIPNPNGLPEVNHKDGNKQNNNIYNLEWCTRQYNVQHSFDTGLHRIGDYQRMVSRRKMINYNNTKGKRFWKKVVQYDKGMQIIHIYDSMSSASRLSSVPLCNIVGCCKGKRKSAGGFIWRYYG